jgi:WhiB family redox-sensing transcriptional regulator
VSDWDDMRALLAGIPALPGAPCKGRSALYERTVGEHRMTGRLTKAEVDDARREALRLCNDRCPALEPCRTWLDALPASRRPVGVVAGVVITAGGTPAKTATPATLTASGAES